MTDGFRERNRGGRYIWDRMGDKVLYDHKNKLLNKSDAVWVVCKVETHDGIGEPDSIWYDYDLAFDQAEKIGGYLDIWRVKKK